MKIRQGFVSNSSSSSFVVVYKVNVNDELKKYMAEEFGKYGTKLLEEYISDKKEIEEWLNDDYGDQVEEEDDEDLTDLQQLKKDLEDDAKYLQIYRVYNSNDPDDMNDDGCWLADHIPAEFIDKLYEEEDY